MKISLTSLNTERKKFKSEPTYHKLTFEELGIIFRTSLKNGLDANAARQLYILNGCNQISQHKENLGLKIFKYFFKGYISSFIYRKAFFLIYRYNIYE
jgi:hypothetical protein